MKKKILSILLILAMVAGTQSMFAFADSLDVSESLTETPEILEESGTLDSWTLESMSLDELIQYALEAGEDMFMEIDGVLFPLECISVEDSKAIDNTGADQSEILMAASNDVFGKEKTHEAMFTLAGVSVRVFDIKVAAGGIVTSIQGVGQYYNVQWHSASTSRHAQGITNVTIGTTSVSGNNTSNPSIYVPVTFKSGGASLSFYWYVYLF